MIRPSSSGSLFPDFAGRLWLVAQDGRKRRKPGCALKCALTGDHFVQHRAEREDIGALVQRLSFRLLGGHEGRSADDGSFRGTLDFGEGLGGVGLAASAFQ